MKIVKLLKFSHKDVLIKQESDFFFWLSQVLM